MNRLQRSVREKDEELETAMCRIDILKRSIRDIERTKADVELELAETNSNLVKVSTN